MTSEMRELTEAELDQVSGGVDGGPMLGILTAAEHTTHVISPENMPTPPSGITPGEGLLTAINKPT